MVKRPQSEDARLALEVLLVLAAPAVSVVWLYLTGLVAHETNAARLAIAVVIAPTMSAYGGYWLHRQGGRSIFDALLTLIMLPVWGAALSHAACNGCFS